MFHPTDLLPAPNPFSPTDALGAAGDADAALTSTSFGSTLGSSVLSDLNRFTEAPGTVDLLPVMAASIRHVRALALLIQHGRTLVRLSVFPRSQSFSCVVDLGALSVSELSKLVLVHVDPEADSDLEVGARTRTDGAQVSRLGPLLWKLAEHGSRAGLLPEISGAARYRLAPGFSSRELAVSETALPILRLLRGKVMSLKELTKWSGCAPEQVCRLLNGLYLQSGLIISRATPRSAFR
jgi:hypothetical protein